VTTAHPDHGLEDLCAAGTELYTSALREGRVPRGAANSAPCLVDLGLLQPHVEDAHWLEPVAPAVALHRFLRSAADRIADERRREERLAAVFEPLMRIDGRRTAGADTPTIEVLSSLQQINLAITKAMAQAGTELLAIQPYNGRPTKALAESMERDQALLDRGGRIRTLSVATGANVAAGTEVASVDPGDEQVWEALRALYLIGQPDDLPAIRPYQRELPEISDRLRQQALLAESSIRARSSTHP